MAGFARQAKPNQVHKQTSLNRKVYVSKYGKEMTLSPPDDKDALCACNSGNPYSACCKPAHDAAVKQTELTATQVLRARFSAACYGLVSFIVDTAHPDMKDYAAPDEVRNRVGRSKREIWAKIVNAELGEQELSALSIKSEEVGVEGDIVKFSVSFDRSIRGQKKSNIETIEQMHEFKKGPTGGWLYLKSADVIDGEEVSDDGKDKMIRPLSRIHNKQYALLNAQGKSGDKARAEVKKVNIQVR